MSSTAISTWFVADDAANASFFPQVGERSDVPAVQAIYWRCVLVFFASSVRVNPGRTHLFFTNTALPRVDGIDLSEALAGLGVETVALPITFRLPAGRMASFGNQFYVFDILRWFAQHGRQDRLIVLDSDCVWRKPVDPVEQAIDAHGVLTFVLGEAEYPTDTLINGLSRTGMARFLGGSTPVPYCGGELFAGAAAEVRTLCAQLGPLWTRVLAGEADAPREEAHLLSVLYAVHGYALNTGNPFIRRMWTTFKHHDLAPGDRDLAIWHLPAEKRTGFRDLFRHLARNGVDPASLDEATAARLLGFPRRTARKLARDAALKLAEKIAARTIR